MGFFELRHDVWGFSRVTTGNLGSLSCGHREAQAPLHLRQGVQQFFEVGREIGPLDALKAESRDLSRVVAGNSGCP